MTPLGRGTLFVVLLAAAGAAQAFDFNGVTLGTNEAAVKKALPSAHCRPLEWTSSAAERRCDDAKVPFAGRNVRVTFYLKGDAVQAFDVRFDTLAHESIAAQLRNIYGKPGVDTKETLRPRDKPEREIVKLLWDQGDVHAAYTAQTGRKRSQFTVWRGAFQSEIYRVR